MLKQLLDVVGGFSGSAIFRFDDGGVRLQTMDQARVMLMDLYLPVGWFEAYKCPKATTMATSLVWVVKILGCMASNQRAWLVERQKNKSTTWELSLAGGAPEAFDKEFVLPLYDIDEDLMELPEDTNADTDIIMDAGRWAKVVDELAMFGSMVEAECSAEATVLRVDDKEQGLKMATTIGLSDVESYDACDEPFKVGYALHYIQRASMVRKAVCLGPAPSVSVHITEGRPLELAFSLGEGSTARFLLAPRVGDDD